MIECSIIKEILISMDETEGGGAGVNSRFSILVLKRKN